MVNKSNKKILIVDDTISITMQIELLLRKEGFETTTANDVETALKAFQNDIFDIVIMDLIVPTEEDGINLLRNLKNCIKSGNINTEIIVMSASEKKENEQNCKKLGADYYLGKNKNWKTELLQIVTKG